MKRISGARLLMLLLLANLVGEVAGQDAAIEAIATTRLQGAGAGERLGSALASVGDINGDGLQDFAIAAGGSAAAFSAPRGQRAAIVFGRSAGLPSSIDPDALDGSNGFRIPQSSRDGEVVGPWGGAIAGGADVNGDDIDDLVVAYSGDSSHPALGSVVVVYGRAGGFPADLDATALAAGQGMRVTGLDPPGFSLSGYRFALGDLDGDGFADLAVTLVATSSANISGYVVFGGPQLPDLLDPLTLDGTRGFRIGAVPTSTVDREAHVAVGDLNGDGIADLVLGYPQAALVRVAYGDAAWPTLLNPLDTATHPGFLFAVRPQTNIGMGRSLAFVPDLNADDRAELVIGAAAAQQGRGEIYLLFGFSGSTPEFEFDGVRAAAILGDAPALNFGAAFTGSRSGLAVGAPVSDGEAGRILLVEPLAGPWPGVVGTAALGALRARWLTGPSLTPAARAGSALSAIPADASTSVPHLLVGGPQPLPFPGGAGRAWRVPWPSGGSPIPTVFSDSFEDPQ